MSLSFGERIRESRKAQNLTQKQLAEMIGAAHNSVSDWENNKNKPDPDTIELLCGVLKITPNYLLKSSEDDFSPKEKQIIKKYRGLDSHGKRMIDFVLNEEWSRSANAAAQENDFIPQNGIPADSARIINYYYRLASAGTGQIVFDTPPTKRITIPNIPEYKRVDYAIGVNGNSMEPVYHDGDTLLVEMTDEIDPGDIGIFLVDNESYVKKLGDGNLISLNPEYHDIPLTEESLCMGRVVAKF